LCNQHDTKKEKEVRAAGRKERGMITTHLLSKKKRVGSAHSARGGGGASIKTLFSNIYFSKGGRREVEGKEGGREAKAVILDPQSKREERLHRVRRGESSRGRGKGRILFGRGKKEEKMVLISPRRGGGGRGERTKVEERAAISIAYRVRRGGNSLTFQGKKVRKGRNLEFSYCSSTGEVRGVSFIQERKRSGLLLCQGRAPSAIGKKGGELGEGESLSRRFVMGEKRGEKKPCRKGGRQNKETILLLKGEGKGFSSTSFRERVEGRESQK